MKLEIPLVSHIYQDQAAKSFNSLPGYVRNCIDFNQFSMKKVKDNLSASRFYYTLLNRYTYFTSFYIFNFICVLEDIF